MVLKLNLNDQGVNLVKKRMGAILIQGHGVCNGPGVEGNRVWYKDGQGNVARTRMMGRRGDSSLTMQEQVGENRDPTPW